MTDRQRLINTIAFQASRSTARDLAANLRSGHVALDFDAMYREVTDAAKMEHRVLDILSERSEDEWGVSLTSRFVAQTTIRALELARDRVRSAELKATR